MSKSTTLPVERPAISLSHEFINFALPLLSGAELKLYLVLSGMQNAADTDWFPAPSKELCAATGLSRSQTYASMWQLLAYRFIDKKAQMWSDGGSAPNLYRLLPLPDEVWS